MTGVQTCALPISAFELAGDAVAAVKVVIDSRQMILLAEGISFSNLTLNVSDHKKPLHRQLLILVLEGPKKAFHHPKHL